MYIIIFEDGSIRSVEKIDEGLLDALQKDEGNRMVWEDIKQS